MAPTLDYDDVDLSTKQKDILDEFRSNLQDILTPAHTDPELLKWLRGNNYDLKKAEAAFRSIDSCRKIYSFNTITEGTPFYSEVFRKFARTACLGFAKDGSAIRYYTVHLDLMGIAHSCSLHTVLLFFTYCMESDLKALKEENEKTGRKHSKITFIIDFDGFCFADMFHSVIISCGLDMFSKFQEFYPETWSSFLLINAPYLIDKILMLFKPAFKNNFMDAFHTATKSSTSALLKKFIDEDSIPVFLGGSKVDSSGDPNFGINPYCKVPEEYYLRNTMHFINEEDPGVKVESIGKWSVFNVPVVAKEPGGKIRIEVRSEDGNICFTIFHRPFTLESENFKLPEPNETLDPDDADSNLRVVAPRVKPFTQMAPFDFTIHVEWPGAYIFYFENGSNWFTSIKLYYRFTLLPATS